MSEGENQRPFRSEPGRRGSDPPASSAAEAAASELPWAPARLLFPILTAVFVVEFGIMALLQALSPLGFMSQALLDATLLSVLVFPMLYLGTFRPLLHEMERRRRVEGSLRRSELRLREAQRLGHIGHWDWELSNNAITWSLEARRILGLDEEDSQLSFDHFRGLIHPDDRVAVDDAFERVLADGMTCDLGFRVLRPDGAQRMIHCQAELEIDASGNPIRVLGVAQDVTERHKSQEALRHAYAELDQRVHERTLELARANEEIQLERNFVDAVVETAGALVIVLDRDGLIVRFNQACEHTSGYRFEEVLGRPFWELLIPPDEVDSVMATFARLRSGDFPNQHQNHWIARDGSQRYIAWANTALLDEDGRVEFVIGTGLDITERRHAEEALRASEERLRTILKTARDGFWLVDSGGRFLDVNDAYCTLSGFSRQELLTMKIADVDVREDPESLAIRMAKVATLGSDSFETRHRRKNGEAFDVEVSVTHLDRDGGQFFTFVRDITDRKLTERLVHDSLIEKEVLLKEIHHRVKNNLQIIASMLNLQAEQAIEEPAIAPLHESRNRIRTLALIHEKLYRSGDLAEIPFGDYVRDLVSSLMSSYSDGHKNLTVDVEIDDLALSIDTAIPVALIVNELVSNSIKHAFPSSDEGRIVVALRETASGALKLVVNDNGNGLPENFPARRSESLGLQLVDVLSAQLGGTLHARSDHGAWFEVEFEATT